MVAKFILSHLFPSWYQRKMDAELQARCNLLKPHPEEGDLAVPKSRGVDEYYRSDLQHAVEKSSDPRWIDSHRVVAISFHKDTSVSKHEYIVLKCLFPGDPKPFYIRLERTHEVEPSPAPKKSKRSRKSSPTVSRLKKEIFGALDEFRYVHPDAFSGSTQLQQFQPRDSVTILDVAVLACLLHADSPRYEIFRRQCFWYAYMVYEIILGIFKADDATLEGLIPVSDQEHKSEKLLSRGKWVFPINDPEEVLRDVNKLTSQFKSQRAEAKQRVEDMIQANVNEKERHNFNERRNELLEKENQMLKERLRALEAGSSLQA